MMKITIKNLRNLIQNTLSEGPVGPSLVDPTNLSDAPYAYDEPYAPGQPFDYDSLRPEDALLYLGFTRDGETDKNTTHPAADGKTGVAARMGMRLQPTTTKDLLP